MTVICQTIVEARWTLVDKHDSVWASLAPLQVSQRLAKFWMNKDCLNPRTPEAEKFVRTNVQKVYRTNSKTVRSVREGDVAISCRPGFKDAQLYEMAVVYRFGLTSIGISLNWRLHWPGRRFSDLKIVRTSQDTDGCCCQ